MADEHRSETAPVAAPAPAARAPAAEMQQPVEPATLEPIYTNFVRVTGSPEELILDFGLNTDATGAAHIPIKISERLVMNYYTAKRLWMALGASLKRQESIFGVLETDVAKRIATHQSSPTAPRQG
ncbi:MAG: DUF3467 domain-containing protein [Deltaproteobacteria bacterium]